MKCYLQQYLTYLISLEISQDTRSRNITFSHENDREKYKTVGYATLYSVTETIETHNKLQESELERVASV